MVLRFLPAPPVTAIPAVGAGNALPYASRGATAPVGDLASPQTRYSLLWHASILLKTLEAFTLQPGGGARTLLLSVKGPALTRIGMALMQDMGMKVVEAGRKGGEETSGTPPVVEVSKSARHMILYGLCTFQGLAMCLLGSRVKAEHRAVETPDSLEEILRTHETRIGDVFTISSDDKRLEITKIDTWKDWRSWSALMSNAEKVWARLPESDAQRRTVLLSCLGNEKKQFPIRI